MITEKCKLKVVLPKPVYSSQFEFLKYCPFKVIRHIIERSNLFYRILYSLCRFRDYAKSV
jgi:hypothetical protein